MKQTVAHELHNPDLLALIPVTASRLIEVGCSSGALAREFKKKSPTAHYIGIDIDPDSAKLARRHCDETLAMDIEKADDNFWTSKTDRDCWVFGDTLEHLVDPWTILRKIRNVIPEHGHVIACIPNAQHWSLQVRLCTGDFSYEDQGLLDKTHLRWFTRKTMLQMLSQCGFKFNAGHPRIFNEPSREIFIPLIEQMASAAGANPAVAKKDALPLQYVIRAIPT
jgi:ubiquinone/menaquinone biosynthesis C-methylase UbiE